MEGLLAADVPAWEEMCPSAPKWAYILNRWKIKKEIPDNK